MRLTKTDGDKIDTFGMISYWDYDVLDSPLLRQRWQHSVGRLQNRQLDTPTNIDTIQWWVDLIQKHKVAPLPTEFPKDSGPVEFLLQVRWRWRSRVWGIQTFRDGPKFNWDIAMFPKGKEKQTAVQWPNQLAIGGKTKHPDEAFNFALFSIRPDRPADTVGIGKVPVVKAMANSESWLEKGKPPAHKDAILKMGDLNVPLEFGFRWTEWRDAMNQELQLSFLGERSVDESLAAAQTAVQAILDRT